MKPEAKPRGIRLQKLLADAGVCSRRAAETLIRQGRVKLNGRTVTELGTRAVPTDRVLIDGKPLPARALPVYVIVNKPVGVVTTVRDPEGRSTIATLIPRDLPRLFPVGRLDVQSAGLVLLTNDGALAERLTHPRHHIPRVYRVKVGGAPDAHALARLRRGIHLHDGPTGPIEVIVERALPTKTWLRITVHEGRHHLVRRLCEAVGHRAEKLQRIAIGPLRLGNLASGAWRVLSAGEVRAVRAATRAQESTPGTRRRVHAGVPKPRPRAPEGRGAAVRQARGAHVGRRRPTTRG